MDHDSITTRKHHTEHPPSKSPEQQGSAELPQTPQAVPLANDVRTNFVSFIFHGMFSFIIDAGQKMIKVAAPIVHDHCYAVRAVTPFRVGLGWSSPVFFIPHGFVSASFLKRPTSIGLPPRDNVLVLPGEEDGGRRWTFRGREYFCMDLPFPTEYGFCRMTSKTTLFEDKGRDLPADDKKGKKYAIVIRFTYDTSSSDVRIGLPFPYGAEFDILSGLSFSAMNYHFYAEPLFSNVHDPSAAFDKLTGMFTPQPDIKIDKNIKAVADAPKACDGLSVEDLEDIGEYLGAPPLPDMTIHDAKLRNCLATFIQTAKI
jgi:hypothetical protein